jgi:hypothetical protein
MSTPKKMSHDSVPPFSKDGHEGVRGLREIIADKDLSSGEAAWECFREYAKERPEVVALWTFGIGFVLGWKLKIW